MCVHANHYLFANGASKSLVTCFTLKVFKIKNWDKSVKQLDKLSNNYPFLQLSMVYCKDDVWYFSAKLLSKSLECTW